MRRRDRAALTLGPLLIRLPLALVFLWAGLGKLIADTEVTPEQAVVLVAAGVRLPADAVPPKDRADDSAPTLAQPLADPDASDDAPDDTPAEPPTQSSGDPQSTPDADDEPAPATPGDAQARRTRDASPRIILASTQDAPASADDDGAADTGDTTNAEAPIVVRRVNMLILMMHASSEPGVSDSDASPTPAVWPSFLAKGPWPKVLAWAACFTEIFAGFFLLIGLLTRFSALSLAGVMGVAMWLATFGPAIQTDTAILGFIPGHPAWSHEWMTPFFQFTLLMAALSLVFTGSGAIALDRAIFSPASDDDDWDDDATPQSLRERHSFDRSP